MDNGKLKLQPQKFTQSSFDHDHLLIFIFVAEFYNYRELPEDGVMPESSSM
jgi:hypothetical protein